jgi:hypothetical protein
VAKQGLDGAAGSTRLFDLDAVRDVLGRAAVVFWYGQRTAIKTKADGILAARSSRRRRQ